MCRVRFETVPSNPYFLRNGLKPFPTGHLSILESDIKNKGESNMSIIVNEKFAKRAKEFQRPLKSKIIFPKSFVEFIEDKNSFQNIKVIEKNDFKLPLVICSGDKILIDFAEHCVGYLNFSLNNYGKKICDSCVKLKFSFGEFPYEIVKPFEEYKGTLGNGWFQREEKVIPLLPYKTTLDRRYAFRYLLIERTDNASFPVRLEDLFFEAVSAVSIEDALPIEIEDERLKAIYNASLKTLKECEQDVFEDGPKRDRRLWMGDLRVQAITDYKTFKNYDLVKRCLYLFAAYRTDTKMVSSCLFSQSPPYIDDQKSWVLKDYCLFFVSSLYDYYIDCGDLEFIKELYDVGAEQVEILSKMVDREKMVIDVTSFIDWCPDLDKEVAFTGVYIYVLKQFKFLTELLSKDISWIEEEIEFVSKILMKYYDKEKDIFITSSGQISQHSQIWAVLSGVLSHEENVNLISRVEELETEFTMRTPYVVHYYLEALYNCGLKEKTIEVIKNYWGKMLDSGYDCCPECFNEKNDFESPYNAPEINSACHAWSCSPAYWIYRYINGE